MSRSSGTVKWGKTVAIVVLSESEEIHVCDQAKIDEKEYVNLRTFVKTAKYTGATKAGLFIPKEKWGEFVQALAMVTKA